ncbi:MAG: hypothetical protein K2L74_00630 [Muribaculaceae bacterium]|nr:hypothetical protein [Muribaculaceae bacterium]MDE6540496.1 hypothetical protein [Muribaculaceae bacterium]
MKIIADSSTTRTEWVLVDGREVVERAFTSGMNPYFQTRREISHCIRLELPDSFFRRRWEHVYFYGAGCGTSEKNKVMSSSLIAQFKTPVTVESDMLGAARGLLVREPGIACILGTGSNSCQYDGREIVRNVRALGFILGDEGSNAYLGKMFIADAIKDIAPSDLSAAFFEHFAVTPNSLIDELFSSSMPSRALARYSRFLSEHIDNPYVYQLIYAAFMRFFTRNVAAYDFRKLPLCFVGSTCVMYREILERAATDFGVSIAKAVRSSMPGLVEYHAGE